MYVLNSSIKTKEKFQPESDLNILFLLAGLFLHHEIFQSREQSKQRAQLRKSLEKAESPWSLGADSCLPAVLRLLVTPGEGCH